MSTKAKGKEGEANNSFYQNINQDELCPSFVPLPQLGEFGSNNTEDQSDVLKKQTNNTENIHVRLDSLAQSQDAHTNKTQMTFTKPLPRKPVRTHRRRLQTRPTTTFEANDPMPSLSASTSIDDGRFKLNDTATQLTNSEF